MFPQTTPIDIHLPAELEARVQGLAVARQRSTNEIVVQALATFVEREELREAIRQECLAASEHCRQTGLHVTHQEVKTWIGKLRQGEKAEPPQCHM